MGHGVGVLRINVVVRVVHHDDLRVARLGPRGDIPVNEFWGDLAVIWLEVVSETGFVIVVGLSLNYIVPSRSCLRCGGGWCPGASSCRCTL